MQVQNKVELGLDAIEISDGLTVEDMKRIFGLQRPPIDTAERRLEAWERFAGGCNVVRVDGVLYSWDTRPRVQKNKAVIGRIHAQSDGESPHDIGSYKLDSRGTVLWLPAPLHAVLPGGEGSSEGDAS